ncbi:hypothetical protein WJX82_006928 [Trebouxia sp. C0006]
MANCAKSGGCRHSSRGQVYARTGLETPLRSPSQRHFSSTKAPLRGLPASLRFTICATVVSSTPVTL